ncbi:THO complex subunit 4A-like [Rosa rugosa]|uniref:THO complex subunit 4A-like n=3 Tax=Rosa rugosa TaxID=74645 RepID=UPI002B413EFB|nr:THO complex subunit 4A-like [Rosa rugosa]
MPFPQDRLDLPLDALIAESKQQRRHNSHAHQPRGHNGHFGGGGSTSGPSRRPMNRNAYRTAPYPTLPEMQGQPGPRRIELPLALSQAMNSEGSTKLYISNLDYDVTNRDIELLFSEVGELERHSIHYDKSGRSKGTAEVVYKHYSDALAAIERYNNQHLDGKKVEIKLVGLNVVSPVPLLLPPNTNFMQEHPTPVFQRLGRAGSRGSFHGHGGVGLERGCGQVRNGGPKVTTESQQWKNVTAENQQRKNVITESVKRKKTFYGDTTVTFDDLDADLEKYRLKCRPVN